VLRIVFGVFIVLHGLVHLFYFGQSRRMFELQEGMVWPDGSWAFTKLLGDQLTRSLASVCCVVAAAGFAIGGVAILVKQPLWRPAVVSSAAFSALLFLLFWDGERQMLSENGAIGLLIDVAVLVAVLIFQWPSLGF
jgi:hypothetical protein